MTRFLIAICILVLPVSTMGLAETQDGGWQVPVSTGAAAGYVPDAVCGECHSEKWESFQQVGMGKSFARAESAPVIENFEAATYYHAPSKRHYEMEHRDGTYWFRRYQLNAAGERIHQFERSVDWVLGSGHHSRVYLVQTDGGELYQLPLAWYAQEGGRWNMAPGFEFSDHLGLARAVRHRCMACHNAFPEVPLGSDQPGMPETYPQDLPEGIGCQRCHGPGEAHLRLLNAGESDPAAIRAAIVNPGKLPREQLYGICYGCHMQPSVAVTPELRLGRGAYSFRPGEDLSDYKIFLDIEDRLRAPEERFDINHHPYRLEQSVCFQESERALGCLSCHDPHVKRPKAEQAAHYRAVCLSCHEVDEAGLPVLAQGGDHPALPADGDCIQCHMPTRRTQDVIHVTMTDHKIQRFAGDLDVLVAPFEKRPPEVAEISLLYPRQDLPPSEKATLLAMAMLRASAFTSKDAIASLEAEVAKGGLVGHEPWLLLSRAYQKEGRHAEALEAARQGLYESPGNAMLRQQKAFGLYFLGQEAAALQELKWLRQDLPGFISGRYNLAVFLNGQSRPQEALAELEQLLDLNDIYWPAYRLKAKIELAMGQNARAIESYLAALQIEPLAPGVAEALLPLLQTEAGAATPMDLKAVDAPKE